ncbi:L,D-transpeptidase family protein [bacterium]|nr:L,D-transpeptidase family protein [bacterium]
MSDESTPKLGRRLFLGAAAAGLGAAALPARAADFANSTEFETPTTEANPRANISSFRLLDWQDYFDNTKNGAILVDITSRALHFWSEDQTIYKLYPTSVPLTEELTRRGKTSVIQKVVNPRWVATKGELERNPDWPPFVEGGSPENPLGVRALYLGWPAYRIHGTHDTRKIGRRSSNGCIGLYNEQILELFNLAKVGTQVLLI